MNDDIPLGSIVRLDMGSSVKDGMLVMRQDRDPRRAARLTVEVSSESDVDRHSISFSSSMYRLELISPPPAGSMLVMCGVGSPSERVRHLAHGRLAALAWLEKQHPDWRDRGDVAIVAGTRDMPRWSSPVPYGLVPDWRSDGFQDMPDGVTGIPVGPTHPGAFGYRRRFHVHEGVDIYVPDGTPVMAMEPGRVVSILPFTGAIADPPTPFWHDTWAVMVEGASGVVLYGEIDRIAVTRGDDIATGQMIGHVRQVLKKEKNPPRPMAMVHVELHRHGAEDAFEWRLDGPRPPSLLDPTEMLLSICLPG